MSFLQYIITQKLTQATLDHAEKQASVDTQEQKAYQSNFTRNFFWGALIIGSIVSLIIFFCSHSMLVAGIFLGLPPLICVPGLMSVYNCWVKWDQEGFTVSEFFGNKHRHTYQDIAAMHLTPNSIHIKTTDGHQVKMDQSFHNWKVFAQAIADHRGSVPDMQERVAYMTDHDIEASYQSGSMREAMVIPAEGGYRENMGKFKTMSSILTAAAVGLALVDGLIFLKMEQYFFSTVGYAALVGLLNLIPPVIALVLYIRHPQYYSAREKAMSWKVHLSAENLKYHKLTPMPYTAVSCLFTGLITLDAIAIMGVFSGWYWALLAGAVCMLCYILISKRNSWEYRNYRVGLGYIILNAFCTSLNVFALVWMNCVIPLDLLLRL